MGSHFDQQDKMLDELIEKTRETNQRLVGRAHDARQPRLAMEADIISGKKTCKRAEDAAVDRAKHEDSCPAKKIDVGPSSSTSFGMEVEPPALPLRDGALVDKGATAPKLCLSPVKTRTLTATGGLLPASTASTATRTIFHQSPLWFCPTKEMNSRMTSMQNATTYSSFC